MLVTLGSAAKQLGISKPTISKAISRGHLSATKREDGSYAIDTSELLRWWDGARHRFQVSTPPLPVSHLQPSTPSDDSGNTLVNTADTANTSPTLEAIRKAARMEAEIEGLKALIEASKRMEEEKDRRIEELRQERDRWASALQASQRQITDMTGKPSRGFFRWLRRA